MIHLPLLHICPGSTCHKSRLDSRLLSNSS
jgi:hypothetical protein